MIRECGLEEISDGRTYRENDMVKADAAGCDGCFKCWTGMGNSIILDPYDIWLLKNFSEGTKLTFEQLLATGNVELNIVDGLILPNLSMKGQDRCAYLDEDGRCRIHDVRPGICRLFPLGRVYDEKGDFYYFLQTGECAKKNLAKIKVKKWTCLRCPEKNREFVTAWHALIRTAGQKMVEHKQSGRGEKLQELAMYILNEFYVADLPEAAYDDTGITTIYESLCNKIENARESLAHF